MESSNFRRKQGVYNGGNQLLLFFARMADSHTRRTIYLGIQYCELNKLFAIAALVISAPSRRKPHTSG